MPRLFSVLSLASAATIGAWDPSEWLSEESKRDGKAYDPAKCWCDDLTEFMSDRISKADEEMQNLESTAKVQHYQNEQLKMEAKEHKSEAGSHSETLGTASAISERDGAAAQDEVTDLRASIDSIDKAMDKVQEGTQIHGTLQGLKDTFSEKLKEAEESDKSRQASFDDLQATKQKMMRLAKAAAAEKEARLAEGLAEVSRANNQVDKMSAQREDDAALSFAARDLCSMLADQSDKRQQLRQAANIATSQAKVDAANAASYKAATKVFTLLSKRNRGLAAHRAVAKAKANSTMHAAKKKHLDCAMQLEHAQEDKRRASERLEDAKKTAQAMMAKIDKSSSIQAALEQMLHESMTGAHVATGKTQGEVQASMQAIFDSAQAQLATLAKPFEAIRAKGKASTMAASRVVTVLMGIEADAAQAVVDAERCH